MADAKLELMVCDGCGAKWFPAVWKARGSCSACSHPDGHLQKFQEDGA